MNNQRAKEILDSKGIIEVRYQQSPVWIQEIQGDMAEVEYLDSLDRTLVPVADLVECD